MIAPSTLPVHFEEMHWQDVPAVMEVEHRSFTLPWSASTYRHELLENHNAHYYVLRQRATARPPARWLARLRGGRPEATIVGYGGFWIIADEAHISTIAVDASWRGRGLGEFLLASMIEQALQRRVAKITLEVRESNVAAQNLYRKYGFDITGSRPRYYQDNQENAYIMGAEDVRSDAYRDRFEQQSAALLERLARADGALPART